MHTGKKTIPKQVWILLGGLLIVPALIWFAADKLLSKGKQPESKPEKTPAAYSAQAAGQGLRVSKEEWLVSHVPRVPGLPHTAPKYDKITEPVRAPVPAACIDMPSQGCKCYSQQGTLLAATPDELCKQIVRQGYFVDFDPEPEKKDDRAGERTAGRDSHPPVDQGSFEMPKRANERLRVSMADVAAAYRGSPAGRIDPNLRP